MGDNEALTAVSALPLYATRSGELYNTVPRFYFALGYATKVQPLRTAPSPTGEGGGSGQTEPNNTQRKQATSTEASPRRGARRTAAPRLSDRSAARERQRPTATRRAPRGGRPPADSRKKNGQGSGATGGGGQRPTEGAGANGEAEKRPRAGKRQRQARTEPTARSPRPKRAG